MARPIALSTDPSIISAVRTKTGAPITADSATLTDANFSPTASTSTGGAIMCRNLATIWIGAEITAAGASTFDLDLLIRDDFVDPNTSVHAVSDGSRWKRLGFGAAYPFAAFQPTFDKTTPLFVEMRVDGRLVYPRIFNVTGNPTSIIILAFPGSPIGAGKGLAL